MISYCSAFHWPFLRWIASRPSTVPHGNFACLARECGRLASPLASARLASALAAKAVCTTLRVGSRPACAHREPADPVGTLAKTAKVGSAAALILPIPSRSIGDWSRALPTPVEAQSNVVGEAAARTRVGGSFGRRGPTGWSRRRKIGCFGGRRSRSPHQQLTNAHCMVALISRRLVF